MGVDKADTSSELHESASAGHPPEGETQTAAARFAANRRYDQRPAIENVERPSLVLTTRNVAPAQGPRNVRRIAAGAGCVAAALVAGTLLGLRLGTEDQAAPIESAVAVRTPTTVAVVTDADVAGLVPSSTIIPPPPITSPPTSVEAPPPTKLLPNPPLAKSLGEFERADTEPFLAELESVGLDRLVFVPGEVNLTPEGIQTLERLADVLLAYPEQPLELRVRTYSESTAGQNHGMSVHQANMLGSMLATAGVGTDRLSVVGLGSHDAERPTASAALFVESAALETQVDLASQFPIVFQEPFSGTFDAAQLDVLKTVAAASGDSRLELVGYAWSGSDADANHHLSHELLDAAVALLEGLDVSADQLSSVGLGGAEVPLADHTTVVTAAVGEAAAVSLAFAAVPVDAVAFVSGTAELAPSGEETMASVAEILRANPEVRVEVAVHFYGGTTSQQNHDASKLQGDTISNHLAAVGVEPERLRVVAHGDPPHFAVPGRSSVVTFTVIR